MIQKIDFYQRIRQENLIPKSVILLGIGWLSVPLLYALMGAYLLFSQEESLDVLNHAELENAQLMKEIDANNINRQSNVSKLLGQELLALQQLQSEKQTLLNRLRDPRSSNLEGFSKIFRGLSRQHVPGIALDRIEVTESGSIFYMSGSVSDPVDLPIYIVRLGEEAVFSKMTFEKLRLKENSAKKDLGKNVNEDLEFEIRSISRI
ncbi:MAG: hypothetical protein ACI9FB_000757 [Candidatus Azotimanducaceae bacterium]|jgi:hypothetical protein